MDARRRGCGGKRTARRLLLTRHRNPLNAPGPQNGDDERHESRLQRLDRNWGELLQELRVVQTAVQLLTGFLLTLPFQQRFAHLSDAQKQLYLVVVGLAVSSTVLLVAPVALHRLIFRLHGRAEQVSLAHRMALAGSALLGFAIAGVVTLIFDVVSGTTAALVAGGLAVLFVASLWVVLPLTVRRYIHHEQADLRSRSGLQPPGH